MFISTKLDNNATKIVKIHIRNRKTRSLRNKCIRRRENKGGIHK